jgi:hypothetical protein
MWDDSDGPWLMSGDTAWAMEEGWDASRLRRFERDEPSR